MDNVKEKNDVLHLYGKPRLPVLPFIVLCTHKLNETLINTWAKMVRKIFFTGGEELRR